MSKYQWYQIMPETITEHYPHTESLERLTPSSRLWCFLFLPLFILSSLFCFFSLHSRLTSSLFSSMYSSLQYLKECRPQESSLVLFIRPLERIMHICCLPSSFASEPSRSRFCAIVPMLLFLWQLPLMRPSRSCVSTHPWYV